MYTYMPAPRMLGAAGAAGRGGRRRFWASELEHDTVSFHNFKSQNFKLSVSNPKNKYVAYLSVLSQISNCQSLGRKNKHDILKTDRTIDRVMERIYNDRVIDVVIELRQKQVEPGAWYYSSGGLTIS